MIIISPSAKISKLVDIEDSIRGTKITIEDNVVIDSFVKIKPAGGLGDVIFGEGSVVNAGCVFYTGNGILIGKNVAIAANCTFAPTNHEFKDKTILIKNQGFKPSKGGIRIEDDVWIGSGCVILDGTHIKRGAVIGAGSIVKGTVEEYSINAGSPLKVIGYRN